MLSTFHQLQLVHLSTLSTCSSTCPSSLFINFLSTFINFFLSTLSTFYQQFINILSTFYQLFINFLSTFYQLYHSQSTELDLVVHSLVEEAPGIADLL